MNNNAINVQFISRLIPLKLGPFLISGLGNVQVRLYISPDEYAYLPVSTSTLLQTNVIQSWSVVHNHTNSNNTIAIKEKFQHHNFKFIMFSI